MAGRERMRLTDAAITRLRPRARKYTVWDGGMPGLGVRVRPTGGRTYELPASRKCSGRFARGATGPVKDRAARPNPGARQISGPAEAGSVGSVIDPVDAKKNLMTVAWLAMLVMVIAIAGIEPALADR